MHCITHTQYTGDPGQEEERRERLKPGPFAAMSTEEGRPSPPYPSSQPLPSVVAIEVEPEALLIGWEEVPGAVCYELQMSKKASASTDG